MNSTAAAPQLLARPIMGGPFGFGRFALATVPCVSRGLHSVKYMVVDEGAGAVLSIAEEKTEALSTARRLLNATAGIPLLGPGTNDAGRQAPLWSPEELPPVSPAPQIAERPVSRRRREIFERSGGACHYCGTGLNLDGAWHVEHSLPRALGGTDAAINLVAACVPCNLRKSDRTAIEFMAGGRCA